MNKAKYVGIKEAIDENIAAINFIACLKGENLMNITSKPVIPQNVMHYAVNRSGLVTCFWI